MKTNYAIRETAFLKIKQLHHLIFAANYRELLQIVSNKANLNRLLICLSALK